MDKFEAKVEQVTPDLAAEWLTKNTLNRSLRQRSVDMYARDMAEGNWHVTGEAIKFAESGELLDGQHRLTAVVLADKTVPMLVVRGLPPETRDVIDTGMRRTAADALRMRGNGDPIVLAGIARYGFLYDEGLLNSGVGKAVSNADIVQYVEKHGDALSDAATIATRYKNRVDLAPTAIGIGYFLTARVDAEAALEFVDKLASGVGLQYGDPILALISRTRQIKRQRTALQKTDALSMYVRAWNAWRKGKSLTSIFTVSNGKPIDVPIPV